MSKLKKHKPRFLLQILQCLRRTAKGKGTREDTDNSGHTASVTLSAMYPLVLTILIKGKGKTRSKKGMCCMSGLLTVTELKTMERGSDHGLG